MNSKAVENKFGEGLASRVYHAFHKVFRGSPEDHAPVIGAFLEQYVVVLVQLIFDPPITKINVNDLMVELLRRSYPPQDIVSLKVTQSELVQLVEELRKNGVTTNTKIVGITQRV